MPAFFLTFIAVVAAMVAGRDAMRMARLRSTLGWTGPLLVTAVLAALAGAALAAWIARGLAPLVPGDFKPFVVAVALLLAGLVTDASGFIILSLAFATGEPLLAAAGGAMGALVVLVGAIVAAEDWQALPLDLLRRVVGAGLILAAAVIALLS